MKRMTPTMLVSWALIAYFVMEYWIYFAAGIASVLLIRYGWIRLRCYRLMKRYGTCSPELARMTDILNTLLRLSPGERKKKKSLLHEYSRLHGSIGSGYVYFVKEKGTGKVKIGKALNPYQRIARGFGVKIPYELEVLYLIRSHNDLKTERMFHKLYQRKRVNGEWFDLSNHDLERIRKGRYPLSILQSMG